MPVAAVVPAPTPAGLRPGAGRAAAPGGSSRGRTTTRSCFARNPTYWAGPPKEDTLTVRIIPEALTQGAEYETGNLSVVEIPVRRDPALGDGPSGRAPAPPGDPRLLHRDQHDPGPAQGRARAARAQPGHRRRHPAPHAVMADRGVRAAGAIPPGIVGYDSTRAPYPLGHRRARDGSSPRPGYAKGFTLQLWRSKRARARPHGAVGAAGPGRRRHPGGDRGARRAERARRRCATAAPTSTSATGTPTIPTPRTSTFPLFHSSNKGPGGNYAFLTDTALDAMIIRLADHARHAGEGAAGAGDRRARLRPRALDLPLVSRSTSGPCSPT